MKYKRVFTFGCSFTKWSYPTWADYLVEEFKNRGLEGYNFGAGGAGNLYIFTKLMEANQIFRFNEEDLVIVSWTSMHREDRYIKGRWITPGNIYNQSVYSEDFVKEVADIEFYYLRDSALITAARNSFKDKIGGYYTLAMNNFKDTEPTDSKFDSTDLCSNTLKVYSSGLKLDFPAIVPFLNLHVGAKEIEPTRPDVRIKKNDNRGVHKEWHPFPEEHYFYLKRNLLPELDIKLSNSTLEYIRNWCEKVNLDNKLTLYSEINFNSSPINNFKEIYNNNEKK